VSEYTPAGIFNGQQVYVRSGADRPLAVGDVVHGFCGGIFGRAHCDCSRVEALGPDWVVVRDLDGDGIGFASGHSSLAGLRDHRKRIPNAYGGESPCCPEVEL
jgi:hypothetical protein